MQPGRVRVLRYPEGGLSIVGFSRAAVPVADATLRLGEEFFFEVECDHAGYLAALQGYKGQWHPLPLSPEQPVILVEAGTVRAPVSLATGRVEPLSEEQDTGKHEFVFLNVRADSATAIPGVLQSVADFAAHNLDQLAVAMGRVGRQDADNILPDRGFLCLKI